MRQLLASALYSSVLRLLTPLLLARLWWRGRREPGYRLHIAERLGGGAAAEPGALWVHAVSLGETRAAAALLEALRRQRPDLRLLLTHGTATGRAAGQSLLHPGDRQLWLPFDTPGAVRRFLRRQRPALGVLMETEVWPNLLQAAETAGVPMLLANARLSVRSAARGERLAALLRPAAGRLRLALAQSTEDALRLRAAGVPQVEVLGNLKYDLLPDPVQLATGRAWRQALRQANDRPVVLAASTREGEESALLQAWMGCRAWSGARRPLLLLVPRHPQRFDEVARQVQAAGLTLARRSAWLAAGPGAEALQADVWLGDSLGEMALYFGLADAGLQGGSFGPYGAHNFIEAAACGCPMLLGPSVFNFAEAAQHALAAGAARQVADWPAALELLAHDLSEPGWRAAAAQRAEAWAAQHRGAAVRMARRVMDHLPG